MRANLSNIKSNKGSALAIGLTILTAITLISVTALQRSGLQGRMVGSIQHKEQGFQVANSELEEIYQFYATQASATDALSAPLNKFDMVNGEPIYQAVPAGHTSTYDSYDPQSSGHSTQARLQVNSDIEHTGELSTLVKGFSVGTFAEYGFVVSAQSSKPDIGINLGDVVSNQVIGIKFIAPAG